MSFVAKPETARTLLLAFLALAATFSSICVSQAQDREWLRKEKHQPANDRTIYYASRGLVDDEAVVASMRGDVAGVPDYWMEEPELTQEGERGSLWRGAVYKRMAALNKEFLMAPVGGPYQKSTDMSLVKYRPNKIVDSHVTKCRERLGITRTFSDPDEPGYFPLADCVARRIRERIPLVIITQYDHNALNPPAPIRRVASYGRYDHKNRQYAAMTPRLEQDEDCTGRESFYGGEANGIVKPSICAVCFEAFDDDAGEFRNQTSGSKCEGQRYSQIVVEMSWQDFLSAFHPQNDEIEISVEYETVKGGQYTVRNRTTKFVWAISASFDYMYEKY